MNRVSMSSESNGISREEQSSTTIKEWLAKYVANWPLFLVCILLSGGIGILYIRYTVPKYISYTSLLVKGMEGGHAGSNDLIESAIYGKKSVNLNNEIRLLTSLDLMERTVVKNALNITYIKKGRILDTEIYKDAPFRLVAKQLADSKRIYSIYINKIDMAGGAFLYGPEKEEKLYSFRWNEPFIIAGQSFVLIPKRLMQKEKGEYVVQWQPVDETAVRFLNNFTASAIDTRSSIIQLSISTENLQKGQDILNSLFTEYNLSDIEDRNKMYESTVRFIDDRLLSISGELNGVEGNMEDFQGSNQLIDIKSQTAQSLGNSNDVSVTIKNLSIQQGIASIIQDYFVKPSGTSRLVPSSLGLNDGTLDLLITQYNELQLKKERELPRVAPNSTVLQDYDTQLTNLRTSILESLNNITKNLRYQESNLQEQKNQYRNILSTIPHSERVMQQIKRKQNITEGLYLYLLQKREETAISGTASNVAHYKQIDEAKGFGPVEPDTKKIIMYAALASLLLPLALIYLKDLLNDKITTQAQITGKLGFPLVGEISHILNKRKRSVAVIDQGITGEQFRTVRTNLSFLMKNKNERTILVTSANDDEGKTFVGLNLASVLALPGKRVALLEFDLRKPVPNSGLHAGNHMNGITDYLTGRIHDFSEMIEITNEIPSLHIFHTGQVPPNPGDLLLSENLSLLFEELKNSYDYIVVDSPPAAMISDAFILGEHADVTLFIIRQGVTQKKALDFISNTGHTKKLKNIGLIFNDVKNGSKRMAKRYSYQFEGLKKHPYSGDKVTV